MVGDNERASNTVGTRRQRAAVDGNRNEDLAGSCEDAAVHGERSLIGAEKTVGQQRARVQRGGVAEGVDARENQRALTLLVQSARAVNVAGERDGVRPGVEGDVAIRAAKVQHAGGDPVRARAHRAAAEVDLIRGGRIGRAALDAAHAEVQAPAFEAIGVGRGAKNRRSAAVHDQRRHVDGAAALREESHAIHADVEAAVDFAAVDRTHRVGGNGKRAALHDIGADFRRPMTQAELPAHIDIAADLRHFTRAGSSLAAQEVAVQSIERRTGIDLHSSVKIVVGNVQAVRHPGRGTRAEHQWPGGISALHLELVHKGRAGESQLFRAGHLLQYAAAADGPAETRGRGPLELHDAVVRERAPARRTCGAGQAQRGAGVDRPVAAVSRVVVRRQDRRACARTGHRHEVTCAVERVFQTDIRVAVTLRGIEDGVRDHVDEPRPDDGTGVDGLRAFGAERAAIQVDDCAVRAGRGTS